jgi:hypothetical protein
MIRLLGICTPHHLLLNVFLAIGRFENDLKSVLLDIDSSGVFTEELSVSVITALK